MGRLRSDRALRLSAYQPNEDRTGHPRREVSSGQPMLVQREESAAADFMDDDKLHIGNLAEHLAHTCISAQ